MSTNIKTITYNNERDDFMNINDFEETIKSVKKVQTKQRYNHTIGVAYTAASLAMKYETSVDQAFLAGILHDCAKCISDQKLIEKCEQNNIFISDFERKCPYLLHSKLGSYYASSKYEIKNQDILNAITYHTTGRPNMSMLEKIIFVADFIEPNRFKASNLDEIRKISFENIDMTVFIILKNTIDYLTKNDSPIDSTSIETYEYYKQLINKDL